MAELRNIDHTFYEANKTSQPDKLTVLTSRLSQVCKRNIVDLLKPMDLITKFMVEDTKFGGGYGLMTSGINHIETYSDDPAQRFPASRRLLADYKEDITDIVRDFVRVTVMYPQLQTIFNSEENFNAWIEQQRNSLAKAFKMQGNAAIRYFFGDYTDITKTIIDNNQPLKTVLDKIKGEFKNTKQYGTHGQQDTQKVEDLYRAIKENYGKMLLKPSDAWHIDNTISGFPVTVDPENMLLVMSFDDVNTFDTTIGVDKFHPDSFKLPDIEKLVLDIPKGTAYIIDKRALQFSLQFQYSDTDKYILTGEQDFVLHYHYFVGLFKLYAGVKITPAG